MMAPLIRDTTLPVVGIAKLRRLTTAIITIVAITRIKLKEIKINFLIRSTKSQLPLEFLPSKQK